MSGWYRTSQLMKDAGIGVVRVRESTCSPF
jgi:hypothetical protein